MDDPLPTTLIDGNTVSEEIDDFTQLEQDSKDDGVVLAQPTVQGLVAPLALSANVTPLDPSAQDAQNPLAKDDENPSSQDTQNLSAYFLFV